MTESEILAAFRSVSAADLDELRLGEADAQYATDGDGTLCIIMFDGDTDHFVVTDNIPASDDGMIVRCIADAIDSDVEWSLPNAEMLLGRSPALRAAAELYISERRAITRRLDAAIMAALDGE